MQDVFPGTQRNLDRPIPGVAPTDRIGDVVDPDGFDGYRRRAPQFYGIGLACEIVSRIGRDIEFPVFPLQLGNQITPPVTHPASNAAGTGGVDTIGPEGVIDVVEHGSVAFAGQRAVDGRLPSPQIGSPKGRVAIEFGNGRIVDFVHRGGRAVAAAAQGKIQIPEHHFPLAVDRFVNRGVLAAVVTVTVPVADDMPDGEDPRPLLDIDQAFDASLVLNAGRFVEGFDQFEEPGMIVVESVIRFLFPIPAIAG